MDEPGQGGGNGWASLLQAAQSVGMRTTMELVSLPDEKIRAVVLPCLPYLDYLVINEIEAAALTGVQIRSADVDGHPDWGGAGVHCRGPGGARRLAPGGRAFSRWVRGRRLHEEMPVAQSLRLGGLRRSCEPGGGSDLGRRAALGEAPCPWRR